MNSFRTWHPDHGGEADHEAEDLAPPRVVVGLCVLDRGVLDKVEDENGLEEMREKILYRTEVNKSVLIFYYVPP